MSEYRLPDEVMNILKSSLAKSTNDQYSYSLRKWMSYAENNNISMWQPSVSNVLQYLYELYASGVGYSTINTAKSALSSVIIDVNGFQLGKHPLVLKFMKGIYKLRPPTARYQVTWDADLVLNLFKSWPRNSELSLKMLSFKLVALLALVTAQRVQTLSAIELCNIVWTEKVQIVLKKTLKCTSIKTPNVVLVLPRFNEDQNLCVVECLSQYIKRTESIRKGISLFISFNKPHDTVTSQTLSRWLCAVLKLAGIDTDKFHGHSFRHSSTSKAVRGGVCIDTILQRVGWSQKSNTFARFYNRPVDTRDVFAKSILTVK